MTETKPTNHWWAILVRGIVAILFALLAFFWTGLTLELLVFLLGFYLLLDGIFAVMAGLVSIGYKHWWMLLLEGAISAAAGIAVFTWPGVTVAVLVILIAIWALVSGLIELIAAFTAHWATAGKLVVGLSGVISIILGLLLFIMPDLGIEVMIWIMGFYALVFGVALITFSFQAKKA